MPPPTSVIIGIYNQPRALELSLCGYLRQSDADFELLVADDGSDGEVRSLLDRYRPLAPFPIRHVWQENRGFRRAKITNAAVRESAGSLLLFSDGDCIPHRDFVRVHREARRPGGFAVGGYVRIDLEASRSLTPDAVRGGEHERFLTPAIRRAHRWRHWSSRFYLLIGRRNRPKAYGANLGVDREAFYAVNGFDENFEGFGKEDSDLRNRLRAWGAPARSVWGRAFVFHLDHGLDPKRPPGPGRARGPNAYYYRPEVPARCLNGLVKESAAPAVPHSTGPS
jgi:glycosyltransferase involved in cell wall biosynthesis